jgi:hypothetical protein
MLIKPGNGLQEGLLPAELLRRDAQVRSHCETVLNPAEQIDLEWLLGINENGFRLMAQLGGEDSVCLSSGNRQGTIDSGKFFIGHKPGRELISIL